jgi:hypothetical protein
VILVSTSPRRSRILRSSSRSARQSPPLSQIPNQSKGSGVRPIKSTIIEGLIFIRIILGVLDRCQGRLREGNLICSLRISGTTAQLVAAPLIGILDTWVDNLLDQSLALCMIRVPTEKVGGEPGTYPWCFPVLPAIEEKPVEVQRYKREHFLAPFLHRYLFLLERFPNLAVHPVACERVLGAAKKHLVPEFDTAINLIV